MGEGEKEIFVAIHSNGANKASSLKNINLIILPPPSFDNHTTSLFTPYSTHTHVNVCKHVYIYCIHRWLCYWCACVEVRLRGEKKRKKLIF